MTTDEINRLAEEFVDSTNKRLTERSFFDWCKERGLTRNDLYLLDGAIARIKRERSKPDGKL